MEVKKSEEWNMKYEPRVPLNGVDRKGNRKDRRHGNGLFEDENV